MKYPKGRLCALCIISATFKNIKLHNSLGLEAIGSRNQPWNFESIPNSLQELWTELERREPTPVYRIEESKAHSFQAEQNSPSRKGNKTYYIGNTVRKLVDVVRRFIWIFYIIMCMNSSVMQYERMSERKYRRWKATNDWLILI